MDRIIKVFSSKKIYWGCFGLTLLLFVFLQYYGLVKYHYPVPPGDDPMNHYNMTKTILEGQSSLLSLWKSGAYPPGYHFLISQLAQLFSADPLTVILWVYPSLLVMSGLSLFVFCFYLINRHVALISLLFYIFLVTIPLQSLNDGNYPNIIAAQVLLPLLFLTIINFFTTENRQKKALNLTAALAITILIVFIHHIVTFYVLSILPLIIITVLIRKAFKDKWSVLKKLGFFGLVVSVGFGLIYLFINSDIFAPARALLEIMVRVDDTFPYFHSVKLTETGAMWPLASYPNQYGKLLLLYAVMGAYILIWSRTRKMDRNKLKNEMSSVTLITLFFWTMVLFLGSRIPFLTNPERIARDMTTPLIVFAAYGFYRLIVYCLDAKWLTNYNLKVVAVVVLIFLTFAPKIILKINKYKIYEPMVRLTSADLEAIDFLKAQNPKNIMVTSYNYYLPKFLPGVEVVYNFSGKVDPIKVLAYDWVYLVSDQKGWQPAQSLAASTDQVDLVQSITKEKTYFGPTSSIRLYRVVKQY